MVKVSQRLLDYIEEYRVLCDRYGFSIGACGCCDSPWILEERPDIRHLKSEIDWREWEGEIKEEPESPTVPHVASMVSSLIATTIAGYVASKVMKEVEKVTDASNWDFTGLPYLEAKR